MRKAMLGPVSLFTPSLVLDFTKGAMPSGLTFSRNSIATRVNSSGGMETVAANVPRIDYDPVTLKCLGLLVEESRTNLHLSSATAFSGYSFTASGTGDSITPNYGTGALGGLTTTRITTGSTFRLLRRIGTETGINAVSTQYCVSFFYSGDFSKIFSLSARAGGSFVPVDMGLQLANGLRRAYAIVTSGTNGTAFLDFTIGINADIQLGDIQVEQGASFPTSYIPTTSAAVTRGADGCTFNPGSWRNPNTGTWLVRARGGRNSVQDYRGRFLGGQANPYFILAGYGAKTTLGTGTTTGAGFGLTHANSSPDITSAFYTHAMSYDETTLNASIAFFGQAASANYTGSYNYTFYAIGSYGSPGGGLAINGHVATVKYFPRRMPANFLLKSSLE